MEIHFLEIPKLANIENIKDKDDPVLEWLKFLDADSKEGMEMLAKKNENIKEAYEILQKVSKSKEARMAYEARQAEIMDQLTREETAKAEGKAEILIKLLYRKFISIPMDYEEKIKVLPEKVIEDIAMDIFTITKVEELRKYF